MEQTRLVCGTIPKHGRQNLMRWIADSELIRRAAGPREGRWRHSATRTAMQSYRAGWLQQNATSEPPRQDHMRGNEYCSHSERL